MDSTRTCAICYTDECTAPVQMLDASGKPICQGFPRHTFCVTCLFELHNSNLLLNVEQNTIKLKKIYCPLCRTNGSKGEALFFIVLSVVYVVSKSCCVFIVFSGRNGR